MFSKIAPLLFSDFGINTNVIDTAFRIYEIPIALQPKIFDGLVILISKMKAGGQKKSGESS